MKSCMGRFTGERTTRTLNFEGCFIDTHDFYYYENYNYLLRDINRMNKWNKVKKLDPGYLYAGYLCYNYNDLVAVISFRNTSVEQYEVEMCCKKYFPIRWKIISIVDKYAPKKPEMIKLQLHDYPEWEEIKEKLKQWEVETKLIDQQ